MVEYNDILNMVSLLLAFIILFIILFGCKCQTSTKVKERFENKEEEKKEEDLSSFEKSILNGLSAGSITTKDLTSLIKNEQFTEKNLDNLIEHVEKFKGGMKS
jgi:flagellar biosynthesis/type III secretory pathway M-ring protein FliF/YscJ